MFLSVRIPDMTLGESLDYFSISIPPPQHPSLPRYPSDAGWTSHLGAVNISCEIDYDTVLAWWQ